jgi:hypothetical protein
MTRATLLGVAMIAAALAIATGCSKNQSATNTCSVMTDSNSCSACCTQNGANGYRFSSGSPCECLGGRSNAAQSTTTTAFAGTYRSNWGATVFTQDGTRVNAKYPRGSMTCQATGNTLDCDWRENATSYGKARLAKEPNGSITGTWGNGSSATSGGPWTFTP